MRRRWPVLILVALGLGSAGCLRGCPSSSPPVHLNPDMDDQPRYDPQQASRFFANGSVGQPPIPGTVARGSLRTDPEFDSGRSPWGFYISNPLEPTEEALTRGRQRYEIFCRPCHGAAADGQSALLEFGKVRSASLLDERIRTLPDGRIFQVISNGQGLMPAYRHQISPADRWRIIAWVRKLQEGASQ